MLRVLNCDTMLSSCRLLESKSSASMSVVRLYFLRLFNDVGIAKQTRYLICRDRLCALTSTHYHITLGVETNT